MHQLTSPLQCVKMIWLVTNKLYVTINNYINLVVAKKYHPTAYLRSLNLLKMHLLKFEKCARAMMIGCLQIL